MVVIADGEVTTDDHRRRGFYVIHRILRPFWADTGVAFQREVIIGKLGVTR
jgi:hypothetical protein